MATMRRLALGAIFPAVLVAASGQVQSFPDIDCESDVELQGLELLQVELRLQSQAPRDLIAKLDVSKATATTAKRHVKVEVPANPIGDFNAVTGYGEKKLLIQQMPMLTEVVPNNGVSSMSLLIASAKVYLAKLNKVRAVKPTMIVLSSLLAVVCVLTFCAAPGLLASWQARRGAGHRGATFAPDVVDANRHALLPAAKPAPGAQTILNGTPTAGQSAHNAPPESDGPPPICPTLILPHTEARFMITIESLMSLMHSSGQLDIRGTSGRKLLHGNVNETPEGRRCLTLASCGCEDDPRVTLLAPGSASSDGGTRTLELYGKGKQFYGTLELASGGGASLRYGGQVVMSLEPGEGADGPLRMTASSLDGRLLASAGKNVHVSARRLESNDAWKLQVKPGLDAVLVAACMLGALLFGQ